MRNDISFEDVIGYIILFLVYLVSRNFFKEKSQAKEETVIGKLIAENQKEELKMPSPELGRQRKSGKSKLSLAKRLPDEKKGVKNYSDDAHQAKSIGDKKVVPPLIAPSIPFSTDPFGPLSSQTSPLKHDLSRLILYHEIMAKPKSLRENSEY